VLSGIAVKIFHMELRGFRFFPALALNGAQRPLYGHATFARFGPRGGNDLLHALPRQSVKVADLFEREARAEQFNHARLAAQISLAVVSIHAASVPEVYACVNIYLTA
jgi:hypothetical protein